MDDELMGALISAAASVAVALISKTSDGKSSDPRGHSRQKSPIQPWVAACAVLGIWFFASPGMIQLASAGLNFFLIPLVVSALVWFRPIQAPIATSVTLGLFALNWIGGRASNRIAHAGVGTKDHTHLQLVLLLACASAVLVFLLSVWRCKMPNESPVPPGRPSAAPIWEKFGSIAGELERLTQLHASGGLSDGEFSRAKAKVLGRPRHGRVVARRKIELDV